MIKKFILILICISFCQCSLLKVQIHDDESQLLKIIEDIIKLDKLQKMITLQHIKCNQTLIFNQTDERICNFIAILDQDDNEIVEIDGDKLSHNYRDILLQQLMDRKIMSVENNKRDFTVEIIQNSEKELKKLESRTQYRQLIKVGQTIEPKVVSKKLNITNLTAQKSSNELSDSKNQQQKLNLKKKQLQSQNNNFWHFAYVIMTIGLLWGITYLKKQEERVYQLLSNQIPDDQSINYNKTQKK